MTEPTRFIISEACNREGIKIYKDTEFNKIAPSVYQFTVHTPNQRSETMVAVIKGFDVHIYQY